MDRAESLSRYAALLRDGWVLIRQRGSQRLLREGRPSDGQVLDAVLEVGAHPHGRARLLQAAEAVERGREDGTHLPAGEVGAEAEVRTVAEREVLVGPPPDVEAIRLGKTRSSRLALEK